MSWSTRRCAASSTSRTSRRCDGLREHRDKLETLTRALLASETLDEEDAYRIAGIARPPKPENPVRIAREAAENGKGHDAPAPVPAADGEPAAPDAAARDAGPPA